MITAAPCSSGQSYSQTSAVNSQVPKKQHNNVGEFEGMLPKEMFLKLLLVAF